MTPADLRLCLTAMPWDAYTFAELEEIAKTLSEAQATARICRLQLSRRHREHIAQQLQQRQALSPEQVRAAMLTQDVGSRFD